MGYFFLFETFSMTIKHWIKKVNAGKMLKITAIKMTKSVLNPLCKYKIKGIAKNEQSRCTPSSKFTKFHRWWWSIVLDSSKVFHYNRRKPPNTDFINVVV